MTGFERVNIKLRLVSNPIFIAWCYLNGDKEINVLDNFRIKYFQKLPLQQDAETKAASKCSLKKFNMQNLAYFSAIPQKVHAASDWLRPFWP